MERIQGPAGPCLLDEHLATMECLQHGFLTNGNFLRLNDQELEQEDKEKVHNYQFSETSIDYEDKNIPFLQMLQCVEQPSAFFPFKQPNIFQSSSLLLQQIQALEPESCLTHETTPTDNDHRPLYFGSISSSPPPAPAVATAGPETDKKAGNRKVVRERRKRKRTRAQKNTEEVENQRMNHIAVERNRRRQMNEHLNSLRSLMPPSYIERGDQASIVGGAIDFIKELEQLLNSLDAVAAGKRIKPDGLGNDDNAPEKSMVVLSSSRSRECNSSLSSISTSDDGLTARSAVEEGGGGEAAEIEATVIQNHVNLKVRCKRRQGQIVDAIVSLEKLSFTILHVSVTSSRDFVFYTFNLKMEDDCKLGSANEIVVAVQEIFKHINS